MVQKMKRYRKQHEKRLSSFFMRLLQIACSQIIRVDEKEELKNILEIKLVEMPCSTNLLA